MSGLNRINCALCATVVLASIHFQESRAYPAMIPVGTGNPSNYYFYNGIPFDLDDGVELSVTHRGELLPQFVGIVDKTTDLFDLAALGNPSTSQIHFLQNCAFAAHVPNNVEVGRVVVHYLNGAQDAANLILGVNTAEWAIDRLGAESYTQHSKITPAYSWMTDTDSSNPYLGHSYLLTINTNPTQPIASVELVMNPEAYVGQSYHGYEPADWFAISISAMTLNSVPEPASLSLLVLGGLAMLQRRRPVHPQ